MSLADRFAAWLPILWFLFLVAVVTLLWASGLIPGLLARLRKVGGFGVEFEFNEATARQTRETVESQLVTVRDTIRRELEADVRARSLQFGLQAVLDASSLGGEQDFRATIHIPDPLLSNSLYQLLDYVPVGGGHGRTFSARAGLIGRAWRTGAKDWWDSETSISMDKLVGEWGMTRQEAALRQVVDKTKVMLAIPLHDPTRSRPVGILYLDSAVHEKFGGPEDRMQLMDQLEALYQERLAASLAQLVEAAMRRSPQLTLEGA